MKKIKLVVFLIVIFLIILQTKNLIFNYVELRSKKAQSEELQQTYKNKEDYLDSVIKGGDQSKYFHEKYKISEDDEILFVFPEDE